VLRIEAEVVMRELPVAVALVRKSVRTPGVLQRFASLPPFRSEVTVR